MGLILPVLALLGRVPWWIYLLILSLVWGGAGRLEASHYKKELAALQSSERNAREDAERTAKKAAEDAKLAKEKRDVQDKDNATRLAAALQRVRDRPDRLPGAASTTCSGGTGSTLSRPDAEFLTGLAARADRLQSALGECQAWAAAVKQNDRRP